MLLDELTDYATYLESTRDYVIAEAVRYIIDRDKEFAESCRRICLKIRRHEIPPQNLRQQNAGEISTGKGSAK